MAESGEMTVGDSPGARRIRVVDVGSTLGRYEVVEELGSGGMATVYRARDLSLRRDVALKVLLPHLRRRDEAVARFHREARAAAALDHPNIVRIYDAGGGVPAAGADDTATAIDPPYLVMELIVGGRSLRELVAAHGPFLAEVVACIGVLLGNALGAAHRAGIIHRDVKPANVLVTERGRVALADFGVARVDGDDSSLVTSSGAILGTPSFMSPEQALSDPLDVRSDIYSLGATLYQLATGTLPYSGPTARVMVDIAEGKLVPPLQRNPAMGKELARVIERMMAHAPDQRYQTAAEASAALGEVIAHAGLGQVTPEAELQRFFADPAAYTQAAVPRIIEATLRRATEAAQARKLPQAMALADRVLALDPGCQQAIALVNSLGADRRRLHRIVGAIAAAGVAAAVFVASMIWPMTWQAGAPELAAVAAEDAGDTARNVEDAGMGPTVAQAMRAAADAGPAAASPGQLAVATETAGQPATALALRTQRTSAPGRGPAAERGSLQARARQTQRTPSMGGQPTPVQVTSDAPAGPGSNASQAAGQAAGQNPGQNPGQDPGQSAGQAQGQNPGQPAASQAAPTPASASLSVDIKPWCDLQIDGVAHGRARADRVLTLAPGRHELECSQGPGRATWRKTIQLAAGEHQHVRGSVLEPVRIRIAVQAGDAVLIDSRTHRNGAALTLEPGRHRITLLSSGREVTGAWVAIPAVPECTLRDQPALDCYR